MNTKSAVFLVVATMIGVGVFTTSGYALKDLGDPRWVLLAWVLGGGQALLGALSYGALARAIGRSGGEYVYLREALHPAAGAVAGWVSFLAGFAAPIAASALTLSAYLGFAEDIRGKAVASAAVLGAGLLHGLKAKAGVALQDVAVGGKLVALFAFVGLGLFSLPSLAPAAAAAAPLDVGAFAVTLVWVSFSYSGWNAAAYVTAEVSGGGHKVERALVGGTVLVTVLYVALNAVFVYAAPVSTLAGQADIGAVAAGALAGPAGRLALTGIVVVALLTSVSSMVLAGPRVLVEMAKDRALPAALVPQGESPTVAVVMQVGVSLVLCWVSSLRELLSMVGFLLGLCAAATVAGLLWLQRQKRTTEKVWGGSLVPWTFVGSTLLISGFLVVKEPQALVVGVVLVLAGILSHVWHARRPTPS